MNRLLFLLLVLRALFDDLGARRRPGTAGVRIHAAIAVIPTDIGSKIPRISRCTAYWLFALSSCHDFILCVMSWIAESSQAMCHNRATLENAPTKTSTMTRDTPEQSRDQLRTQGMTGRVFAFFLDRIDEADPEAAGKRVAELRRANPEATSGELVEMLIKRKVQQTAAIGAATAGSALIPGLGTVAALTVGAVADFGATLKLQTELVLEIAEVHGRVLTPDERRQVVMLVSGLSAGGAQLLSRGSARLSLRLTQRYAERWLAKAIPVAGVAASAAANVLSTYLIGTRADAYFSQGPDAVGTWKESLRTLVGVDERKLAAWLADTTWRSPAAAAAGQRVAGLVGGTARALGGATARARAGASVAAQTAGRFLPRRARTQVPRELDLLSDGVDRADDPADVSSDAPKAP